MALGFALLCNNAGRAQSAAPTNPVSPNPKIAAVVKGTDNAPAQSAHNAVPLPRPRPKPPAKQADLPAAANPVKTGTAAPPPAGPVLASATSVSLPASRLAYAPAFDIPPAEVGILREAVSQARNGKTAQVTELQKSLSDPLARKLVEWALLRSDNNAADFSRYAAFLSANPSWPSLRLLRRKAESLLWQEPAEPGTVRAYFVQAPPLSAKGRFALARALLALGNPGGAQAQVREAWRNDPLSPDLEEQALDHFKDLLTPADHRARMEMRLYVEDVEGGLRSANRAGGLAPAIAKAWIAVIRNAPNAKSLLDAVELEAGHDLGYIFARAHWLRHADHAQEAARLVLSAPRDPSQPIDSEQWWIERRVLARKLLDLDDAQAAYLVVRDAVPPSQAEHRWEPPFTAGWIALRFLDDPATAMAHFTKVAQSDNSPTTLARAGYWQGRAAEALSRQADARGYFEAAARYPTAYYGQIARAKLGYHDIVLRAPPDISPERHASIAQIEVVRAVELLYATDQRDLVVPFVADLGERSTDISALAAVGEIAAHHADARCTLLVGKAALGRGLALEHYAFPTIGIPDYRPIGPAVDPSVIYAIARQESQFWQGDVSSAKAVGLMQVTPEAGIDTAKRFGAAYDWKRLQSDRVYNVQIGAAELAGLLEDYRGSYIMTFAGYNAGRGRVREWVSRYGDPRDPQIDPVDWVERIPFQETRNYVERVLENLQVYRVRLGGGARLLIEADLRRGATAN
jgi:soluble lytic murein transglycosylase